MKRPAWSVACSALYVLFSLLLLVVLFWELGKTWTFTHMGDMWSLLYLYDCTPGVFSEVDQNDFPGPPIPDPGDTLKTVDGLPATKANYFDVFSPETEPGTEVPITFASGDTTYHSTVVTRSIPTPMAVQVLVMAGLRVLIVLAFVGIALVSTLSRPRSPTIWILALFCLGFAAQITMNIALAETYALFEMPQAFLVIIAQASYLAAVAWVLLGLRFPRQIGFYSRHKLPINLALVALVGFMIGRNLILNDVSPDLLHHLYPILLYVAGFVLLIYNHHRAESFLEERQTRLVLIGAGPGVVLTVVSASVTLVYQDFYQDISFLTRFYIFNVIFLVTLLIPVSLAYAIRRYRLLEIEAKFRRGTRFFLVNVVLLAVMLGLVYVFANLVLEGLGVQSRTPTLVVGLVLALGFVPGQRRIRSLLEDRFYPEKARMRSLLRDFLETSVASADPGVFWKELEDKLEDGLGTEQIFPVLRPREGDHYLLEGEEQTPFRDQDEIVSRMAKGGHPLLADELAASDRVQLSDEQRDWLRDTHSALLLPLKMKSGLIGFLALGSKGNGEDYSPEELDLLHSLSVQIAVVAENLNLLEDRLEKQKLQQQLSVARSIQEGLLPSQTPPTPGLELQSHIRFCLDVAGDYFDVLAMGDGRTVVAIGDVAGKGMGPALLMANLQASLRTTQEMSVNLSESVTKVNSLVYGNTPSDMFITLFVASYDPGSRELSYVNAGHNPPIVLRANGSVSRLETGGLLLGVTDGAVYREGKIVLANGDVVLLYTDGVTEAMDDAEREFGERRLIDVLRSNADRDLSVMLSAIEDEVIRFTECEEFRDDFTLVALRASE